MVEGKIDIDLHTNDADIYRALISKGIAYAVGLIGKKMVIKEMQAVDKQFDAHVLKVVSELKIYDLFDVL
jgi:hypothetical protein